jgi:adenylate cyclase
LEREQRWQLRTMPASATNERLIIDHYIVDTTLRLRMVEEPDGAVYKVSQKVRVTVDEPERVKITNTYLTANEFDLLCILPSSIIAKNRWTVTFGGFDYAVDEFRGRHEGLVLAERELDDDEDRLAVPEFAEIEVTNNNEYSGGWLSNASDADIHRLISAVSGVRGIS